MTWTRAQCGNHVIKFQKETGAQIYTLTHFRDDPELVIEVIEKEDFSSSTICIDRKSLEDVLKGLQFVEMLETFAYVQKEL